jgi:sulfite reductase (ferredoxin)
MAIAVLSEGVVQEIENFRREVERLQSGAIPEEKFKRFRLQHGIYGQRQKDVQMVRVKIPAGILTADKLRALADIAEHYSTGKGHVTTRQDVQFHFIKLDQIPAVMTRLAESGLTTREACGNTVRNVTSCHLAGFCPTELFDVTPYSRAVSAHLLRNPINQDLPRKFKISFSGCTSECGLAAIHDIGFIATSRVANGAGLEYGFRVWVGGGLGSSPKLAKLYTDFLPISELLPTCEAILKLFDTHGNRKTRSMARMKFILEKWGLDAFKAEVARERAQLSEMGRTYPDLPLPVPTTQTPARIDRPLSSGQTDYDRWLRTNVSRQAMPGICTVQVRLIVGDITAAQLRGLADLVARFSPDAVRATHQQNFILHHVRQEDLTALYEGLSQKGLADAGAEQVADVIACPGTDTCQLGLTSSMGLGEALVDTFARELSGDEALPGLRIRISGCPNSCAQHHIAGIGLHGVAKKINGTLVPHFQFHLGGGVSGEHSAIGKAKIKIPAKNVPAAVLQVVQTFRKNRLDNEAFNPFVTRWGADTLAVELAPFASLPPQDVAPESYRDYKSDQAFDLEDLGPGECAGTMIDLIENHLRMAGVAMESAALSIQRQQPAEAIASLRGGILKICRALLVPFGIDSPHDEEILKSFQHKVVEQGIVSERFEGFTESLARWKPVDPTRAKDDLAAATAFLAECQAAYDQMDANLKLKKKPEEETMKNLADAKLDLSGVACPMNFVRTKLQLEEMDAGQRLHVILDDGEPMKNVPKSVQAEGHKLLALTRTSDGHYDMLVEKGNE